LVAVVGLGNPGARYARTRHNAGFRVIEILRPMLSAREVPPVPDAEVFIGRSAAGDVLLVKPLAWMNRSGPVVVRVLREHGLEPGDLLVVSDDVNLPLGKLRFRLGGGPGGHNGLASIVEALGCEEFARLRIGVGFEGLAGDLTDFVLGPFDADEEEVAQASFERAAEAVVTFLVHGPEKAMNDFNR
jgi:PTH1 family peptidyl-tRNA hydrolase